MAVSHRLGDDAGKSGVALLHVPRFPRLDTSGITPELILAWMCQILQHGSQQILEIDVSILGLTSQQ
jgi:hypothetical protein